MTMGFLSTEKKLSKVSGLINELSMMTLQCDNDLMLLCLMSTIENEMLCFDGKFFCKEKNALNVLVQRDLFK